MALRTRLYGDEDEAKAIAVSEGQRLLEIMKNQMRLGGISFLQWTRYLPNGDSVLVQSFAGNDTIQVISIPKPLIVSVPGQLQLLLVLATGSDVISYDADRKYYMVVGDGLVEIGDPLSAGWILIDDGKYAPVFSGSGYPADPDGYTYSFIPDTSGIGVPAPLSGISAWQSLGNQARMLLCNCKENTIGFGLHYTVPTSFNFAWHRDSLIEKRYDMRGIPMLARYTKDGIVIISEQYVEPPSGVEYLQSDKATGDPTFYNYLDRFEFCSGIYTYKFDRTRNTTVFDGTGVLLASARYVPDTEDTDLQRILRPIRQTEEEFPGLWAVIYEPVNEELLNLSTSDDAVLATHLRFKTPYDHVWNVQTANDFKLMHGITYDGKLDYVHIVSDDHANSTKVIELYCADNLIEAEIVTPQAFWWYGTVGDDTTAMRDSLTTVWDFRYQILQSYHDKNFDILIYRKTSLLSVDNVDTGFKNGYYQNRKITAHTQTTWHMAVNGIISQLPIGDCRTDENFLIPQNDTGVDGPNSRSIFQFSWSDITGEHMARIFISAAEETAILCYETFDVAIRHDLMDTGSSLYPKYDNSVHPFMPSTDAIEQPKSRVCLIVSPDGNYTDVSESLPAVTEINRINGVCLIGRY